MPIAFPRHRIQPTSQNNPQSATPTGWKEAPSLQAAAQGEFIKKGMGGPSVIQLQEALNKNGYNIQVDGKFGNDTLKALKSFQRKSGCQADGIVGPQTLRAMLGSSSETSDRTDAARAIGMTASNRAPTEAETREGLTSSFNVGNLVRADNARRSREAAASARIEAPAVNETQDARLARFQSAAMNSARAELDAGVKEDPSRGPNKGARVEEYAKKAGMPPGEWCGHFTGWNYTSAAEAGGAKFTGQKRLHSYQKARSYFMYRSYTDNSRAKNAEFDALRTQHQSEGSERRYMTFEGSRGDEYATQRNLPHEVYNQPSELPIREGDTALFKRGHVGMVENYDRNSGILTTIEGNVGDRVQRKKYNLNDPAVRAQFDGFGRPAAGDFVE